MHFTLSVLALASTAAAVAKAGFEFPADVPLDKRQTSGPRYECHANCGFALQNSEDEGYCDDSEWLELFNGCLDCALEFDIWRHYGNGLTPAAEACGLDATPKPADGGDDEGDDETTSAVEEATTTEEVATETSAVDTTTVDVTATEESTVATATASVTATEETSSAHHTESHTESHAESVTLTTTATWTSAYVPTGTGSLTPTSQPDPTNIPGNGAGQKWVSSGLVGGAAIVLAVNLM